MVRWPELLLWNWFLQSIGQSCCFDDRCQALIIVDTVQTTNVGGPITRTIILTTGAGGLVIGDIALAMVTRVIVSTTGFGNLITRPLAPLVKSLVLVEKFYLSY